MMTNTQLKPNYSAVRSLSAMRQYVSKTFIKTARLISLPDPPVKTP